MTYSQKDLAELVDLSTRRVQQINNSLTYDRKLFVKKKDGGYDLKIFLQNWISYQVERAMPDAGILNLEQIKAKHEIVKMEKSVITNRKIKGELLEAQDVVQLWSEIVTALRNRLLNLGSSIAPKVLAENSVKAIKKAIDKEINVALNMVAECPLPENDYEYDDDDEEESEE